MIATVFTALNEASVKHAAAVRDAITHIKRVVREAQARSARERADNAKLADGVRAQRAASGGLSPAMNEMQKKARKFRVDNGLPVLEFFDPADASVHTKKTRVAPKSDDDEDFSQ